MRILFLLALSLFLFSCASTMPGQNVSTGSNEIAVTIKKDSTFSNEIVQMYQFSIKNNSMDWIELDGAKLSAGNQVLVLVGENIESWIEACMLEKKVSDYNTQLVLGAIAVGGAVVAGGSSHQQTSSAGAIVALGAISGMAIKDYQKAKNRVDFQKAFPEKHIFQNTIIPPGKVVQRWILVENRKKENFTLNFGEGINVTVEGSKSY